MYLQLFEMFILMALAFWYLAFPETQQRPERKCQEAFYKYHVFAKRSDWETKCVPNN